MGKSNRRKIEKRKPLTQGGKGKARPRRGVRFLDQAGAGKKRAGTQLGYVWPEGHKRGKPAGRSPRGESRRKKPLSAGHYLKSA